jgi:hypothetical protein
MCKNLNKKKFRNIFPNLDQTKIEHLYIIQPPKIFFEISITKQMIQRTFGKIKKVYKSEIFFVLMNKCLELDCLIDENFLGVVFV